MRHLTFVFLTCLSVFLISCDVETSNSPSSPAPTSEAVTPSMAEAIDTFNEEADIFSPQTGESYIPVPKGSSHGSGITVPEEEELGEDPLERWRLLQEERAAEQRSDNVTLQQPSDKVIDRSKLENRRIAENHKLSISVQKENLTKLYNRDFERCIELGCEILSTSLQTNHRAYLNARIPPENLGEYLDFLSDGLGDLISHSVTSDDKTLQYIDTQSKLENQQALRERLIALLNSSKTEDIESILKIEMALARVEKELDSAKRSLRHLQTITGMATIQINYNVARQIKKVEEAKFIDNFERAWKKFKDSVADLIQFIAEALPWIVFWLIVMWTVIKTVRFALRNKKSSFFSRSKKKTEKEGTVDKSE